MNMESFKNLFEDEQAVSPVIGVILMVAITVILAAVIGTFVLGLGDQVKGSTAPQADFSFEANSSNYVTVTHVGGDSINTKESTVKVSYGSSSDTWAPSDSKISAGDSKTTSSAVSSGSTVRVVWTSADGSSSSTIAKYEV